MSLAGEQQYSQSHRRSSQRERHENRGLLASRAFRVPDEEWMENGCFCVRFANPKDIPQSCQPAFEREPTTERVSASPGPTVWEFRAVDGIFGLFKRANEHVEPKVMVIRSHRAILKQVSESVIIREP